MSLLSSHLSLNLDILGWVRAGNDSRHHSHSLPSALSLEQLFHLLQVVGRRRAFTNNLFIRVLRPAGAIMLFLGAVSL